MRAKLNSRLERGRVGLLVSVRSASEALEALAGGADVIDVKEPTRGSLGAADREVIEEVVRVVADRVPVTAAGGELLEHSARPRWSCYVPVGGVAVVKFGFAGCAQWTDWRGDWRAACDALAEGTRPVAVAYADWKAANAIAPYETLRLAVAANCPAVLVDTWDKSGGSLFGHWSPEELSQYIAEARGCGLLVVLAGSLSSGSIHDAITLFPDFVAVRGAACDGGRNGTVSRERVAFLAGQLSAEATSPTVATVR
jgi:uncharacterized protein (UPF0264 family)